MLDGKYFASSLEEFLLKICLRELLPDSENEVIKEQSFFKLYLYWEFSEIPAKNYCSIVQG